MYKIDIITALKELELSEKSRGLTKGSIKRNQDFVGRFLKYINSKWNVIENRQCWNNKGAITYSVKEETAWT